MLKKAKSDLIRLIFSFVDEGQKLKLVKYNKRLSRKININLINYQLFKGIFLVYESNFKVKEYNYFNNKLIFEGEYLNGKRNGNGVEYYPNGKLKFKGEYLNGKRNGEGKEYKYGQIIFEGEYLNDKKREKENLFMKIIK